MKGYAYLDVDGKLNYKLKEYIDTENPTFWQDNKPFILIVWQFNTEDMPSMLTMYQRFKTLQLKTSDVLDFSKSIGFSVQALKEYAGSV